MPHLLSSPAAAPSDGHHHLILQPPRGAVAPQGRNFARPAAAIFNNQASLNESTAALTEGPIALSSSR